MKRLFLPLATALLAAACARADFRPPSFPIVSCDPFFSVWMPSEDPTRADSEIWFGDRQPIRVQVELDGIRYRLMGPKGEIPFRDATRGEDIPALKCTGYEVRALTTVFTYTDGQAEVELSFMTPKFADELDVFSRPVTYGTVKATGVGRMRVFAEVSSALATNDDTAEMVTNRFKVAGLDAISIGRKDQKPLSMKGDRVRCDWGYATVVNPVSEGRETHFLLAYDDILSVQFMEKNLVAWWRRDGKSYAEMLAEAEADYDRLVSTAESFDGVLFARAEEVGGVKYAALCTLAYRQSFAACKLVAGPNGQPLYFGKENTSNGSIGTVDCFYPQMPLLLLSSTRLAHATLEPILIYATSGRWQFPYSPHDVGTYPLANGQTYQMPDRISRRTGKPCDDAERMPIEECGNMIISLTALAGLGDAALVDAYWPTLNQWANYLEKFGFDPGEQLCTDDFAGRLAHNANLSIKTIVSFACFARLAERRGEKEVAAKFRTLAEEAVPKWMKLADGGAKGAYRLAFDQAGTWSMKYNLVWDRILKLGLFPPEVAEREVAAYRVLALPFGLPLDSRKTWTKTDWQFWCGSLTGRRADLDFITDRVFRFVDETPDRHPFSDWYWAGSCRVRGFLGRNVIGGVFMPILADRLTAPTKSEE